MRIGTPCGQTLVVGLGILLVASLLSAEQEAVIIDECRQLVSLSPEDLDSYRCFWTAARRSGDSKASEEALRQLLRETPGNPRALLFLGSVLSDQGRVEAGSTFELAARGFAEIGHLEGECLALVSAIAELNRRRQIAEAEPMLKRAYEVAEASGDEELVGQVELTHSWHLVAREEFDQASQLLDRLELRLTSDSSYAVRYRTFEAKAFVAWATGRYRASSDFYRKCLELARDFGDVHDAAASAYNMLLVTARIRGGTVSIEYLQDLHADALDAALKSGDALLEANARMSMGQPFDGDSGRRAQIVKALAAARRAENRMMEMAALRGLAQHDARSDSSHWPAARASARQAVVLAQEVGNADALVRGLLVLATTFEETRDQEQAVASWRRAIDEIENLYRQQITQETAARVASRWSFAYYDLFERLIHRSDESSPREADLEEALAVMERLRGHSRGELMTRAGARGVELPEPVVRVPMKRLRDALVAQEAVVCYQLTTRGNGWAVVISREHSAVVPLPDLSAITEAVDLVAELIGKDDVSAERALSRLSTLVIDPVLDELDETPSRMVVVADGDLHRVPFAALRSSDGQYLVESCPTETVPSLLSWLQWRENPAPVVAAAVVAFANPSLAEGQESPRAENDLGEDQQLEALPYSRAEVKKVCRLVGNNSVWFSDDRASQASLTTALQDGYPILHLATHAIVDGDNPQNTAVWLAPAGEAEDGRLTISDILALDHRSRLVIVNACRSASGVILQGRGVLGLVTGFHESGARTVIGNLWPVGDRDAHELMLSFYEQLGRGACAADALATAQREAIRRGESPRVWASLSLHGDGLLAFEPAPSANVPRLLVGFGLLIVAGLVVVMVKLNGRRVRD